MDINGRKKLKPSLTTAENDEATSSCDRTSPRHESRLVFIIPLIVGALLFIGVYGFRILNPTYVDWILNAGGDLTQSYYGWRFFRASDWHFPIGLMDSVCYPYLTSIIYIDSVPLFNLIFKVLSPVLPETFQFFGIWGLCCFALSAGIGSKIIHRLTGDAVGSVLASPIFALTTFVLQRLYVHTALGANWLILLCAYVVVVERGRKLSLKDCFIWAGVFSLGVGVNIYYLPILGVIMLLNVIFHLRSDAQLRWSISVFVASVGGTFICFWQFGGLYHLGSTGVDKINAGELSANINSFINPMQTGLYLTGFSGILPTRSLVYSGQYEGYAYLGFGVMALCLFAFVGALIFRQCKALDRRELVFVAVAFAALVVASCGVLVSFDDTVLFRIPYPHIFNKIWSTFRSNGRFIWGAWDVLVIAVLVGVLVKYPKIAARMIIVVCVVLQIVDLRGYVYHHRGLYGVRQETYDPAINLDDLNVLLYGVHHVQILNPNRMLKLSLYYDMGEAVLDNGCTINDFYYSRRDSSSIVEYDNEQRAALDSAQPDEDILYVFSSMSEAHEYQDLLHLYFLDGLVFGRVNPCEGLSCAIEIGNVSFVASLAEAIQLNSGASNKTMLCLDVQRKESVADDSLNRFGYLWVNEDGGGHALGFVTFGDAAGLENDGIDEVSDAEYWTFDVL